MKNLSMVVTKIGVSLVAVGSLTFAGVALADAATPASNPPASNPPAGKPSAGKPSAGNASAGNEPKAGKHQVCTLHRRHEEAAERNQARFAANTAKFAALGDKARKAGDTKLANYWDAVVTHRTAHLNHMKANAASRYAHPAGGKAQHC